MNSSRTRRQQRAAIALLEGMLAEVSPGEVDLVQPHVHRIGGVKAVGTGALGLGVEFALPLLLPALLPFVQKFLGTAVDEIAKLTGKSLVEWATKEEATKEEADQIDPERLSQLSSALRKHLVKTGTKADHAARAADALIAVAIAQPATLRDLIR